MKDDITTTENSPWVKPQNARSLALIDLGEGEAAVRIVGPKGSPLGQFLSTTEDVLAWAKEIVGAYDHD